MTSVPCYDHLGNQFDSEQQMLRHYKINYSGFHYRMDKLGWSLEDALTKPHKEHLSTAIECIDHEGNKFESKAAMCDYWHIPRQTFFRRIRDGWDLQKALTEPVKHTNGIVQPVIDPKGNKFITIDEMCKHWNISKKQYMMNIRNNCSLEDALTLHTTTTEIKDHLGNTYPSINAMCREYHISKTTLRSRIELGWLLKDILTNPSKKTPNKPVMDHKGNKYTSQKEMLEKYGIHETKYKHRLSMGLSLEECLSPQNLHVTERQDHLGNKFACLQDMVDYWNISASTYHGRMDKLKWTLEKTLTTITTSKYNTFSSDFTILKQIDNDYYEINMNGHNMVVHKNYIFDTYRKEKGLTHVRIN